MLSKLIRTCKWRKWRLYVWNNRLLRQLELLSRRIAPAVPCSLHVSWGPFYGGSVTLDRKIKKAEIYIQIPYDRYVTSDELDVMSRYSIPKKALPYFILFHEYFHLLDASAYLQGHYEKDLNSYQAALKKAAEVSVNYRILPFEQNADRFAYEQYIDLCKRTG